MSFDIDSLLKFSPPRLRCPRCLGLWVVDSTAVPILQFECPICGLVCSPPMPLLASSDNYYSMHTGWSISGAGQSAGLPIYHGDDPIGHARELATLARHLRGPQFEYPPWRLLVSLLLSARSFVHFTSFGLSLLMLGMLRTVAQRVPVYGVVSGLDRNESAELRAGTNEAPELRIHEFGPDADNDLPHTKLVVIDGLVAFTGSMNFTHGAWRKATKGFEALEVHTIVEEVVGRNNRYFAPLWAQVAPFEPGQVGLGGWRYYLPAPGDTGESSD